nr:non-ribosomal peptide synthetase [Ruminococcus sp. OA3]
MVFPLSQSQQNIWNLERTFAGTSINNISTTVRIHGRVDFVLLQKSIEMVLEADISLRTQLTMRDDMPMQYHVPYREQAFEIYDFTHTNDKGIESWEATVSREVLPLLDMPLYRFVLFRSGENEGGVFIKVHHIISDGWSQMLLCNRIAQYYLELLAEREPQIEFAPDYRQHVEEEEKYLASRTYSRDREYWEQVVRQSGEPSVIKSVKSAAVSPVGRRLSFQLPQTLNHAIYSYCIKNRVAPFAVFYMALAIYFRRIGGAIRFTIGTPIVNRINFIDKQSTGMFVNTLPFYNEINDDWNLDQFNEALMDQWYEMLRHQRFPFSHIAELADRYGREDSRLFHIALSYQDSKVYESPDASVTFQGRWHYSGYQAEQLCIHLSNMEDHRQYSVDYDYLTQLFSEDEIYRLHENLENILQEALGSPSKPIYQLAVLSKEERERVLYTFNHTGRTLEEKCLYDVFSENVRDYPKRVAVICGGERMTYEELDHHGAVLSAKLQKIFKGGAGVAVLLLPRDFSLFTALTGVLHSGNAYLLLSAELPAGRIRMILEKSDAGVLVTQRAIYEQMTDVVKIPVIFADEVNVADHPADSRKAVMDDLAYIVYTSGSTGEPKGVEITQKNLLNFCRAMTPVYGRGAVLSVCNTGFDAFTIESTAALLNGRTVVLPKDMEQESPRRLAELIRGYAVGFLSITPSRLTAFLKEPAFCCAMRTMESIVCGGEAFPGELLKQLRTCTGARIYNQYGPSETTVGVTVKELGNASAITIGKPMPNCRMYILDPWMNPLPAGVYGELYIGGLCVGRGYRGDEQLTREKFIENPFETGEIMYATGDAACWTQDGEILLAGRFDRQVKLRGLRVEPQEIADCIASYPGVKEAAAKVCDLNGQMVLAAYYCADVEIPEVELLTFAASYLPRYMIPAVVVRMEKLPLLSSGKTDESRLPVPVMGNSIESEQGSALIRQITAMFSRVLKRPEIKADSDYFLYGGNSLNAMEVLGELEEQTGQLFRVSDLYACRTARRLAQYISKEENAGNLNQVQQEHLKPAPSMERYPLSPIQQGIYIQTRMDEGGLSYHMPGAFRLREDVDTDRLEHAFERLITEDPLFRTEFVQDQDGVFARVRDQVEFSLQILSGTDLTEVSSSFVVPFDLAKAPLLRAGILKDNAGENILLIDVHHIIGDGMSTPLMMSRLERYYQGGEQKRCELSYLDFAYAVSAEKDRNLDADKAYWKEHLTPLPEQIMLPTDFPRRKAFDFKGGYYVHRIQSGLSGKCSEFCAEQGISPYMLFLAVYGILLSAISGKREMIIGTPVSMRLHRQLKEICGPFINTLPLRLEPHKAMNPAKYLQGVKEEVNHMLEHQNCSLEDIISALNLPRTFSGNPLYQAAFSMRPFDAGQLILAGGEATYLPVHTGTTKTELFIELVKEQDQYELHFEYASSYFLEETIALYGRCMESIVEGLVKGKAERISELPLLMVNDRISLLEMPNYQFQPFANLPVHQIIQGMAKIQPDHAAVIWHGKTTTYEQLMSQAARIASGLLAAGAEKGERIGLAFARTPALFAGMLGILMAGGAYVPVQATLPQKRICYMAETAGVRRILCDKKSREMISEVPGIVCLEAEDFKENPQEIHVPVTGEDLIHVIFTSGSTGRPKGVMIRHRSVSNLYQDMKHVMKDIDGAVLCTANVMFDIFIVESLFPLAMGNHVVLADEEEMLLPWKLADLVKCAQVQFLQMTASRLALCFGNKAFREAAQELKLVIAGGESLNPGFVEIFRECSNGRLVNMYGPTEATVCTTMAEIRPGQPITIGRPLPNYRVYLLDEEQQPVLPTAYGELYLAGEGISEGYVGHPELTEQAFFKDLYFADQKMYKSGDMGRMRADGSIEFLGRQDDQVKINGQRVELTEIMSVMLESKLTESAVVFPAEKPDGSSQLCAYYVPSAGAEHSEAQMENWLRASVPAYMVPSRIHTADVLPVTDNGKIDILTLKQRLKEETVGLNEMEQPGEDDRMTEKVLHIWSEVLGCVNLSSERSFFEQGGTSLGALNVLSRFFNEGLEMTMAQFYENPTARGQAELFRGTEHVSRRKENVCYPAVVPKAGPLPKPEQKAIFVTGATGFFGAHLLYELISSGARQVLCLVRGADKKRLSDALTWYFGAGFVLRAGDRIRVVFGDLEQPHFGMTEDAFRNLADYIGVIYHCAADVRHYAADESEFLERNVGGTRTVIELARCSNAVLHHMSTASISGEYLKEQPDKTAVFSEQDFYIGQNWEDNIYLKSKFLAEHEVYRAVEKGLQARVYRLGRLINRSGDGVFQRNPQSNAAFLLMRAVKKLGCIPVSMQDIPVDLTPVDWCARAVLALCQMKLTACHLLNSNPPTMLQTARILVPELSVAPDEQFDQILADGMDEANREILAPLLDFWNRMKGSKNMIRVVCTETRRALTDAGFTEMIPAYEKLLTGLATNFDD